MPRLAKTRRTSADAPAAGPVLDLTSHIATRVAVFANRLSRSASRFYRAKFGIGVVEWRLMMFIGYVHETCANRICRETDLDKGAVSRSLNVLARMGVVSVREDGSDSRRNRVSLTAKGRALHDRLVPVAVERQRELLAGLTGDEIAAFTGLIARMQARVSDGAPASCAPLPKAPLPARAGRRRAPRRDGTPRRPAAAP